MANPFASRLSELGGQDEGEEDPVKARLAELNGPPKDARGHEYDPRFAPQPGEENEGYTLEAQKGLARPLQNTGSYESMQAQNQADKKNARTALYGTPQAPSKTEALTRGGLQGATLGFGDEAAALVDYGASKVPGLRTFADVFQDAGLPAITDSSLSYQQRRDAYRQRNRGAEEAHPALSTVGEVGGSLVPARFIPGGPGVGGAVKSGGLMGAIQGLGKSEAELSPAFGLGTMPADQTLARNIKQAGYDVGKGGIAGAVTGGVLHGTIEGLIAAAPKNARGWVVNDIIGDIRGASTATARKQLADDAVDAARVVRSDRPLDKAIDAARHGSLDEVQAAKDAIAERLQETGARLSPGWQAINDALPEPITSGRLIGHLGDRIKGLRATGHTTDRAEADALEAIQNRLRTAEAWGADKTTFNPDTKIAGGALDGMKAGDAIKLLEKSKVQLLTREAPRGALPAAELPATQTSQIPLATHSPRAPWMHERSTPSQVAERLPGFTPLTAEQEAANVAATRAYAAAHPGARAASLRERFNKRPDVIAAKAGPEGTLPVTSAGKAAGKVEHPMAAAADLDAEIARVTDAATTKGFDPNHEVTAEQLQRLWSDEAGIAYQSQGGVNGTATFNRKLDVAGHLRDLRDDVLTEAAKNDPQAVAAMQADLTRYSALKRMEQVMDMRLNSAKAAGNSGIPDWMKSLGRHVAGHGSLGTAALAAATGHPHAAALIAAPLAYKTAKRATDRGLASLVEASGHSAMAKTILRLIQSGVPRAAAIQAARTMSTGGMLSPIVDQAADSLKTAVGGSGE
jgi:hypothetical protein